MSDFYCDENYSLSAEIVDGSSCGILSFCGIGLGLGEIQINEFSNSFDGDASLVFLKDLKRSWWNNGDAEALINKAVTHLWDTGCEHIFAIGNSMGGSGALLASALRSDIERVYAFVPQADPYQDRRWNEYTDVIENIRWSNFAALDYQSDVTIFMGDQGQDDYQIKFFQDANKDIYFVKGWGHDAAKGLKEQGDYEALIDRFLRLD